MYENRLKLVHLVFSLETGGLENGVVNLCNGLDKVEFAPSICVFQEGGALESRLDKHVELVVLRRRFRYDPTLPVRLARYLSSNRIDVVHTHSWGTLLEGFAAAKLSRTPILVHGEHGIVENRRRNRALQRGIWLMTSQVTAVAEDVADRMAAIVGFPRERIRVIPNGVNAERFQPEPQAKCKIRKELGLPESGFLIGSVARLVPVKNHLGILRALSLIKRQGVQATLALAGAGPLRDELSNACQQMNISDHVHFMGHVSRVPDFLCGLDVFVLNSHSEGMSNTILEAMACGLPVVATFVGENPTLVDEGETGYLVGDGDVQSLANALTKLSASPSLRRSLGDAGRRRVEERYSIGKMVMAYTQLYHQLHQRYSLQERGHATLSSAGTDCSDAAKVNVRRPN